MMRRPFLNFFHFSARTGGGGRLWKGLGIFFEGFNGFTGFGKVWAGLGGLGGFGGFGRVWVGLEGIGGIWECQKYRTVAKNNYLGEFGRVWEHLKMQKSVYLSAKQATTTIPPDLAGHRFTMGKLKFWM